jgi:ankyrin repeat protein
MNKYKINEYKSDFIFYCNDGEVLAHKSVLGYNSKFFDDLIYFSQKSSIEIDETTEFMTLFINFIYDKSSLTNQIKQNIFEKIVKLCDHYQFANHLECIFRNYYFSKLITLSLDCIKLSREFSKDIEFHYRDYLHHYLNLFENNQKLNIFEIDVEKKLNEYLSLVNNSYRKVILQNACKSGNCKLAKLVLDIGIENINKGAYDEYHNPMSEACLNGHFNVVVLLYKVGAIFDRQIGLCKSPILLALHNKHYKIVEFLSKKAIEQNS